MGPYFRVRRPRPWLSVQLALVLATERELLSVALHRNPPLSRSATYLRMNLFQRGNGKFAVGDSLQGRHLIA